MAGPTVRDVHVDSALTNLSVAHRNADYIAEFVFPRVPVAKRTDVYYVYDHADWFRSEIGIRAPGTRARRVDYAISTSPYACINYAIAKAVPDEVRANADSPLRPDVEATEFVTDMLLQGQEIRVADLLMTTTNWKYSACPTTQWSSSAADPFADISTAVNNVIVQTGRRPNVAVMSWDVWRYLQLHPDFVERVKYTRPGGTPTLSDLGSYFDVSRVLVGYSVKNTGKVGQSASQSYVWGDGFWVGYVTPTPSLMNGTAGYTFEWQNRTVRVYREDQEHQDVIEAQHYVDEVIASSYAGALLADVI